jgi:hypothetical protein
LRASACRKAAAKIEEVKERKSTAPDFCLQTATAPGALALQRQDETSSDTQQIFF